MPERIDDLCVAVTPERVVRFDDGLSTRVGRPLMRGVAILHVDMDRHRSAPGARRGRDFIGMTFLVFRKLVVNENLRAIDIDRGMHQAFAVFMRKNHHFSGAERLLVKFHGIFRAFDAQMRKIVCVVIVRLLEFNE